MKMKKKNLKNTLDATKYMFASVWKKPDGKKIRLFKIVYCCSRFYSSACLRNISGLDN